tara:strand:- start:571 stop:966 length:396 start_codon:yes stop_codon:yes gene_type:complete
MPTTTTRIVISSTDLLSSTLSVDATATLTQAGGSTAIANSTGLAVKTLASGHAEYKLFEADDYTDDKASKLYLKSPSTNAAEYFLIKLGTTQVGRLYAGDVALIPWDGTQDVMIDPSADSMALEYLLFHEG